MLLQVIDCLIQENEAETTTYSPSKKGCSAIADIRFTRAISLFVFNFRESRTRNTVETRCQTWLCLCLWVDTI